jgi:large subunit ribosomal protein L33
LKKHESGRFSQNRPDLAKMNGLSPVPLGTGREVNLGARANCPHILKDTIMGRETVWLQCTETQDLNYRISIDPKEFDTKKMIKKFSPRLRKHTDHKIKKK